MMCLVLPPQLHSRSPRAQSPFHPCFAYVSPSAFRPRSAPPPQHSAIPPAGRRRYFSTVRQSCSLIFGSRNSRGCALSRSYVPSSARISRGQPATSAARIAARRRVVAMAQVTQPAPGYLTRHYTDNRRAGTSSPDRWCSLLNGRHQSGTTISRPSGPPPKNRERRIIGLERTYKAREPGD